MSDLTSWSPSLAGPTAPPSSDPRLDHTIATLCRWLPHQVADERARNIAMCLLDGEEQPSSVIPELLAAPLQSRGHTLPEGAAQEVIAIWGPMP